MNFVETERLDLMEQTGFGIPLVTKRYGKSAFEFLDFFLRVTIPFAFEIENEEKQDSATIAQRLPRDCPEVAQRLPKKHISQFRLILLPPLMN